MDGHLAVEDGQTIKTGEVLVKIPRAVGGAGDITGGLYLHSGIDLTRGE